MKSKYYMVLILLGFLLPMYSYMYSDSSKYPSYSPSIYLGQINLQDSLKLLNRFDIDYGLTNNIELDGSTTYVYYKNKIRWVSGVAIEVLNLRSPKSITWIKFSSGSVDHEIEEIRVSENKNKVTTSINVRKEFETKKFGFKIGDRFTDCIKSLAGLDFKIERSSSKECSVDVHGLIKYQGIAGDKYDEYKCSYCFYKNQLNLIQINYYRDVTLQGMQIKTWPQKL